MASEISNLEIEDREILKGCEGGAKAVAQGDCH